MEFRNEEILEDFSENSEDILNNLKKVGEEVKKLKQTAERLENIINRNILSLIALSKKVSNELKKPKMLPPPPSPPQIVSNGSYVPQTVKRGRPKNEK